MNAHIVMALAAAVCLTMARGQAVPATATFRDCADCPEMIAIPPGTFLMGSTKAEADAIGRPANKYMVWERPQHAVTIAHGFALGTAPVTRREYAVFAAAVGDSAAGTDWQSPGILQTDTDPVVKVSWNQAQAYLRWLSQKTGKAYRLPSEAEWEYAARAGTTTMRWWGDALGVDHAACDGCGSRWDGNSTAPVRSFAPNPFGLFDMLGNVFQMTADCWNPDYEDAPTDGSAWLSGDCEQRPIRGGSYNIAPRSVRSSARGRDGVDYVGNMLGFRVAR